MATLTCVVTDDDALSRQTLEAHIGHTPGLHLAGSFADGPALLNFLHTAPAIDILFLDVQMPLLSGLDVIRLLRTQPAVVLTTSSSDFAVEAFALRVTDYLVKPVEYARFLQAVALVRDQKAGAPLTAPAPTPAPRRAEAAIYVQTGERLKRVPHDDIVYVEVADDQLLIVTTKGDLRTTQTLQEFATRLPAAQFARVHRSYLINRRRVNTIVDATLYMEGNATVPIGRTYLTDVLALFS